MNRTLKFCLGLFVLLILIYVLTAFNVTISNDSCTNIEQIAASDILKRSSHFGFNFLGVLFYKLGSVLGPISPVFTTQFMLAVFSALGSIGLFLVVFKRHSSFHTAILATLIYALSSNVWRFSLQSEYVVLVPSLGLIACAFWVYSYWFWGSVFFALALLTSPFALFILPFVYQEALRIKKNQILGAALGFFLCYGLVSYFTYEETLNGEWSYNLVYTYYVKAIASMKPIRIIAIWLYGYLRSFHVLLPFFLFALWRVFRQDRKLFFVILVGVIIHIPAAIPEIRYGAYQMTFYPFLASLLAVQISQANGLLRNIAWGALVSYWLLNTYIVNEEGAFKRQLAQTYTQMQNDRAIPDSSVVLMYQATKPLNTVYAPRLKGVAIYSTYQEKLTDNLERFELPDYSKIGAENPNVYLIESGTSMPDDKFKHLLSGFVKNQGAKLKGFGLEKAKKMYPNAKFDQLHGYSIPIYKLTISQP
jgi:hypothetical protein